MHLTQTQIQCNQDTKRLDTMEMGRITYYYVLCLFLCFILSMSPGRCLRWIVILVEFFVFVVFVLWYFPSSDSRLTSIFVFVVVFPIQFSHYMLFSFFDQLGEWYTLSTLCLYARGMEWNAQYTKNCGEVTEPSKPHPDARRRAEKNVSE